MAVKKINNPITLSVLTLAISGLLGASTAMADEYHSHSPVSTAGNLDTTFGIGGFDAINASAGNDYGKAGVVQKDRKVVIATDIGDVGNRNIQVRRLNEDGSPDTSFGTGGAVTIDLGAGDDTVTSIALDVHKGRIVIAGYHTAVDNTTDVIVARLTKDGVLDASFGTALDATPDGVVDISVGAGNDKGNAVAIQKDSKIVVTGSSDSGTGANIEVIRLNTDGTLDASFGTANDGTPDGIVNVDLGAGDDVGNAVAIQENGRIVVAGNHVVSGSSDIVVARFLTDGTLDASFGTANDGTPDGVVDLSLGGGDDTANSVAIVSDENDDNKQDHGKIVIVGSSVQGVSPNQSSNIEVIRLNKEGSLDTTFAASGIANLDFGAGDDLGNSVALQNNGRIVVAGSHFNAGSFDMVVARFLSNGTLDPSFGAGNNDGTPDGVVDISVGASDDTANSVALQGNMKIVVTGSSVQSGSANIEVVRLLQH